MSYARIRLVLLLTGAVALSAVSSVAQPVPSPVQTLKAKANLVVVDVVATDSKQVPIHNLKASDFTVLENGSAQQISSFEEHVTLPAAQLAKIPPMRPLPAGLFTNFSPVPAGSAVNILLLDALNTHMKDQSYVMSQLREYLKNTPVGTRIAIFVLNDRLMMLQGFTSDLALLKSVVERPTLGSSMLLSDSSGHSDNVGNGGTQTASEVMNGIAGDDMAQLISSIQQSEAMQASADTQNRAKQTLEAMNQLAHYLSGIPGRKNLIWFSGSFPITILPSPGIAHPFEVVGSSADEFRETSRLLARAQVAVYPIDARGLQVLQASIAADSGPASSGKGLTMAKDKMFQDNANEHGTMNQMAADTGGHAYVDTNGLSEAVAKAIDSGSNYYTISYVPANTKQDGGFRKIQVKLAQQGVTLSYRAGYYADEAEGKHKVAAESATTKPAEINSLTRAMMRGAPPATEILLKMQVLPANTADENTVAPGNELMVDPATKRKAQGPFRRYAIDIAANTKDVQITQAADGHYQFTTEVLTFVYDVDGVLINRAAQKARGNLSASTYANMLRTGLPFHQEISVPVDGQFYLRTSVHDLETDRYGAVELPVASVAKLAPLAPAPAAK